MAQTVPGTMRQWVMASRPDGTVREENFRMETVPVPPLESGQVLVKVLYLGVAPVMMRYMKNETTFEPPMEIGDVMRGRGVGQVVSSQMPTVDRSARLYIRHRLQKRRRAGTPRGVPMRCGAAQDT